MRILCLILFILALAGCARPEAIPDATGAPTPGSASPTSLVLARKGLTGRLVLILYQVEGNRLVKIDLASGEIETIFQPAEKGWLSAAAVSPDGAAVVMAYSPPPADGKVQFGYTGLYRLPYDGSGPPEPLVERSGPEESFFNPTWSPDGEWVYYAHFFRSDENELPSYLYQVERVPAAGGTPELVVENAIWPRLSPTGTKLAYLSFDPKESGNYLYLAEPDGADPIPVIPPGTVPAVDAHLFIPDGTEILFSAVNFQAAPARSWLDRLLGVQVATAHNVPSDWYRVSLAGGEPQRLTELGDTGLFGAISPGGDRLAFIGSTGLYMMNLDGSDLWKVADLVAVGTLDWIP